MALVERLSYAFGLLLFAIGLIWSSVTRLDAIPFWWDQPSIAIFVMMLGVTLMALSKVLRPERVKTPVSSTVPAADMQEAWLKDELIPDFASLPRPPPKERDPTALRQPATPLEPEVNYPPNVGKTRFDIRFPQRRTRSWMGGVPKLSDDIVWPLQNGAPERFVAQIAISDLSPMIWSGRFRSVAYENASLVFFENSVVFMSGDGLYREFAGPGLALSGKDQSSADILASLGALDAHVSPRWFLTPCPDASGVMGEGGRDEGYQKTFDSSNLTDRRLLPFDWPLALFLIRVLQKDLDRMLSGLSEEGVQNRSSDIPERRSATRELLADINYLEGQVEGRATQSEFTIEDRDWFLEQLEPMTNAPWLSDTAAQNGVAPRCLLDLPIFEDYLKVLEFRIRQSYCRDRKSLPSDTRRLFERLWAGKARRERLYAGNCIEDPVWPSASPLLLMVPDSALASSDMPKQAWFLSQDALNENNFSAVEIYNLSKDVEVQARSTSTEPTE